MWNNLVICRGRGNGQALEILKVLYRPYLFIIVQVQKRLNLLKYKTVKIPLLLELSVLYEYLH